MAQKFQQYDCQDVEAMTAVLRKNMRRYFEEDQGRPMKIDIRWERDPLPRTVASMGETTTVSKELASIEREFMELGEVFKAEPEQKKPLEVKKEAPKKKEEPTKEQKSPEKAQAQTAVVRAIPTGELYAVKTNVTKEKMERNGGVTTLVPVLDDEKSKENVGKVLTEQKSSEKKENEKEKKDKGKENEKKVEEETKSEKKTSSVKSNKSSSKKKKTKRSVPAATEAQTKVEEVPQAVKVVPMPPLENNTKSAYLDADMNKPGSIGNKAVEAPVTKDASDSVKSAYLSSVMDKPNPGGAASVSLAVGNAVPEEEATTIEKKPKSERSKKSSKRSKKKKNSGSSKKTSSKKTKKSSSNKAPKEPASAPVLQKTEEDPKSVDVTQMSLLEKNTTEQGPKDVAAVPAIQKRGDDPKSVDVTQMSLLDNNTTDNAPKEATPIPVPPKTENAEKNVDKTQMSHVEKNTVDKMGSVDGNQVSLKKGKDSSVRSAYLSPAMDKPNSGGSGSVSLAVGNPVTGLAKEGNSQDPVAPTPVPIDVSKDSNTPVVAEEAGVVDGSKQPVNSNTRSLYLEPTMEKEGAANLGAKEATTPVKTGINANTRSLYLSPDMEKIGSNTDVLQGKNGAASNDAQGGAETPTVTPVGTASSAPKEFTPSLYMDVNMTKLGENQKGLNQQAPQGPSTSNTRSLYLEPTMEKGNAENQALIGEKKGANENQKTGNGAQILPDVTKEGESNLPVTGHSATTKSTYLDVDMNKLGEIEGKNNVVIPAKKDTDSSVRSAYLSPVMGKPGVTDQSGTRSAYFDKNVAAKEGGGPTEQTNKLKEVGSVAQGADIVSNVVKEGNGQETSVQEQKPKDSNITSAYMDFNVAKEGGVAKKKETAPTHISSTRSLYLEPTMQKENMENLGTSGDVKEGGQPGKTATTSGEAAKVQNEAPQLNPGTKSVYAEPIIHKDVENAAILDQKKDL